MLIRTYIIICLLTNFYAKSAAQANRDCRVIPSFMTGKGLDLSRTAFSTSDRHNMGLVATEVNAPEGKTPKMYKHPSWKNAGWLGPMVITEKGEIWVAPIPVINTIYNKPDEQNILWKVDNTTGIMKPSVSLPVPDVELENQNPYGLMALGYDCDSHIIYASSVSGSTIDTVRGVLYAIDSQRGDIVDTLDGLDAFGLGVGVVNGTKRLYFGLARTSDIYSVGLLPNGKMDRDKRLETTLLDLGPRGDDRARKLRFLPDGTMVITGIEFYFNLTAPTEKQETVYQFKYQPGMQKWQFFKYQ